MSAHSKIAPPSSAGRWVPCPDSAWGLDAIPVNIEPETDASEEGVAAHWYAAQVLTGQPLADRAPNGQLITPAMIEGAHLLLSVVAASGLPIYVEQRVTASAIHPECWGTCDVFAIDPSGALGVIYVWDYKFGFRDVPAVNNWQLTCYSQGVLELAESLYPGKSWTFQTAIVQPRNYSARGQVKPWNFPDSTLAHLVSVASRSAAQIGSGAPANSGAHCLKCPKRFGCDAFTRSAALALDVSSSGSPLDMSPLAIATELKLLREAAAIIAARIDAVEANAKAAIRAGKLIPGWTLERGRGNLKWTQPVRAVIELATAYGVDLRKPVDVVTPTQAIKMGIDESVIREYSERVPGAENLNPVIIN